MADDKGPPSIITLTTDFGEGSRYVAAMKGVILSLNPAARIVDVSHRIAPQNVRQGAIVLAGQAVQSLAEWQGEHGPEVSGRSTSSDPDAYARSVDRLRAFDPTRVHFAHDAAIWQR